VRIWLKVLVNAETGNVATSPNTSCFLAFILRLFITNQRTHK
jgi:hypothetical protein